jgi:hypothetical protein
MMIVFDPTYVLETRNCQLWFMLLLDESVTVVTDAPPDAG